MTPRGVRRYVELTRGPIREELLGYLNDGMSMEKIAEQFGVHKNTIQRWVEDAGLERRWVPKDQPELTEAPR